MSGVGNGTLEAKEKTQDAPLGRSHFIAFKRGKPVIGLKGVMVLVMDAKPKPSMRNYIAERIANGLCLIPGCEFKSAKRGVCTKHYQQFRALLVSKSGEDQVKFEMKQIRDGKILASNHGRPKDHVNAYAETA